MRNIDSVLRSVKPYWFYLICEGKKKLEIGKNAPDDKKWNRITYLYCSKDMRSFAKIPEAFREKYRKYLGTVGAKFVCDEVETYCAEFMADDSCKCYEDIQRIMFHNDGEPYTIFETSNEEQNPSDCRLCRESCVSFGELRKYIGEGFKPLIAWRITALEVYPEPKELSEFYHPLSEEDYDEGNYSLDCIGEVVCLDAPEGGDYCADCPYGGSKPLKRPPMSWFYAAIREGVNANE